MNKKPSRYSLLSPKQKAGMAASSRIYRAKHREEAKAFNKHYRLEHKEEIRLQRMAKRYGINKDDFDTLLHNQGGVCAICRKPDWNGKGPHVDHDHVTGKVRGILCTSCNMAIGHVYDDPKIAQSIVDYLKKSKLKATP